MPITSLISVVVKMQGLASIILVTYNQRKYLDSCIKSICAQDFPHEIIIVDNNSSDGTVEFVKSKFPNIKAVESGSNMGYGAGNNLGAKYANGEYLVVLNPDTIVEKDWLKELIAPLKSGDKIITTPKILVYDGSSINTCGTINHFTGLTFTRGLGEKPDAYSNEEFVSGISGCCFAVRKEHFQELGGFDENLFMYMEDTDISWRAHLKGFKIVYVPKSIMRHDYALNVSAEKIYHLEKGRYIILRKYLSTRERFKIAPSLFMVEILTFGYAIMQGASGIRHKFKAVNYTRKLKLERVEGDTKKLFKMLSSKIPVEQLNHTIIDRAVKHFANFIFELNYRKIVTAQVS